MLVDRPREALTNRWLRKVQTRIRPAECALLKMGQARYIERDFVCILTETIDVLKIDSMKVIRGVVNGIAPLG